MEEIMMRYEKYMATAHMLATFSDTWKYQHDSDSYQKWFPEPFTSSLENEFLDYDSSKELKRERVLVTLLSSICGSQMDFELLTFCDDLDYHPLNNEVEILMEQVLPINFVYSYDNCEWLDNDSLQSILYDYFDFNISEDSDIADYEMLAYKKCTYTAVFFQYATSDDASIIEETFSLNAIQSLIDSYVYTFNGTYKDMPGILAVLCISPPYYANTGIVTDAYDYMCIPTAIYLMGLSDSRRSRRKTHEQY